MPWYQKTKWSTAKKTEYNGISYDSKFESSVAYELDMRLKAKEIAKVEPHYRIPIVVNGYKVWDYICDFKVTHNDGSIEWVESKGKFFEPALTKCRVLS